MPPETEITKTDEVGTMDGEAVHVVESVPETAQNEPKIAESPTSESGQIGGIDPIASVETSMSEAGAVAPVGEEIQTVVEPVVVTETSPAGGVIPAEPILMTTETVAVPNNVDSSSGAGMTEGLDGGVPAISEIQNNALAAPTVIADVVAPPVITSEPIVENKWSFLVGLFAKAREKLQFRKRKKLDRILAEVTKKGKITNNEVEKLLRISDKTADRYLSQLIKEGKIKTNGLKGRALFYLVI